MTELRKKRRRRRPLQPWEIWCSFGKHRSTILKNLVYEFPGATICAACQMAVAENLRSVVDMPEMSEAMFIRARKRDAALKAENAARAKRVATDPDSSGYVYYMRINGQIKIGYTANLRQRSRHYPPGTELLAVEPGTTETERRRHSEFVRDLARGREWFRESPALAAHIEKLSTEFPVPAELMHQYRKHEGAKHV